MPLSGSPIPEMKLQPCPKPIPLKDGSHQAVEAWAVRLGYDYQQCSDRLDDLIQAVRNRDPIKAP